MKCVFENLQLCRSTIGGDGKEFVEHILRIVLRLQLLQLWIVVAEYVFGHLIVLLQVRQGHESLTMEAVGLHRSFRRA